MLDAVPSLRHLQVIEAVARLKSITRASAEILLTQPAVTQSIAKLEVRAGSPLFERRITGTYLTEAGHLFLERTNRIFSSLEDALQQIGLPETKVAIARRMGSITRAQIRALVAISQSQSQAQAAALLGISQASLHRAARDLERNVGASLYHRAASGVMTTQAGELLANRFELAINELEELYEEIRQSQGATHRCIRFGALMLDPATLLGSVMVEFTRRYPDTIVKVTHAPYETLRQKLRAGALDFIVGVQKGAAEDLTDTPLFDDPYVIAARRGHPLLPNERVTAEDMLKFDWIVPNQGAPRHAAFSRLFAPVGREPSATIETHSLTTMRMMLVQSDRLTLLTRSELNAEQPMGAITALPHDRLEPVPVIAITTRKDWVPTERKQAFLDLLDREGQALQAAAEVPVTAMRRRHAVRPLEPVRRGGAAQPASTRPPQGHAARAPG